MLSLSDRIIHNHCDNRFEDFIVVFSQVIAKFEVIWSYVIAISGKLKWPISQMVWWQLVGAIKVKLCAVMQSVNWVWLLSEVEQPMVWKILESKEKVEKNDNTAMSNTF